MAEPRPLCRVRVERTDGTIVGDRTLHGFGEPDLDTLDAVAKESAEGAAEKNGYEIVGGPEDLEVGDYEAVGYAYEDDEGTSMVEGAAPVHRIGQVGGLRAAEGLDAVARRVLPAVRP